MEDTTSSSTAQIQDGLQQLQSSLQGLATTATTKTGQKRQYEIWKKSVDYENQLYRDNFDYQTQVNLANYEKQRNDAYAREDFLNANSKKIEVEALRNAGLNPSWSQEGAGSIGMSSVASSQVGSSSMNAPGGQKFDYVNPYSQGLQSYFQTAQMQMSLRMQEAQIQSMETQNAKTVQETQSLAIDNESKADENALAQYSLSHAIQINDDGSITVDGELYSYDEYMRSGHQKPTTLRGVRALNEWNKLKTDSESYLSSRNQSKLDYLVSSLQIDDPKVLEALSHIDEARFRDIVSAAKSKDLDNEVKDIAKFLWRRVSKLPDDDAIKALSVIALTLAKL